MVGRPAPFCIIRPDGRSRRPFTPTVSRTCHHPATYHRADRIEIFRANVTRIMGDSLVKVDWLMVDKYRNYVGRRAPRDPHLDTDLDNERRKIFPWTSLLFYFILFLIVIVYHVGINDIVCQLFIGISFFSLTCDSCPRLSTFSLSKKKRSVVRKNELNYFCISVKIKSIY